MSDPSHRTQAPVEEYASPRAEPTTAQGGPGEPPLAQAPVPMFAAAAGISAAALRRRMVQRRQRALAAGPREQAPAGPPVPVPVPVPMPVMDRMAAAFGTDFSAVTLQRESAE